MPAIMKSESMIFQENNGDAYWAGLQLPNCKREQIGKGIMETICCEVIGCKSCANWLFVSLTNASREVYLCGDCWQRLNQRQPDKASDYIRLDELCETVVNSILLKEYKDNSNGLSLKLD